MESKAQRIKHREALGLDGDGPLVLWRGYGPFADAFPFWSPFVVWYEDGYEEALEEWRRRERR